MTPSTCHPPNLNIQYFCVMGKFFLISALVPLCDRTQWNTPSQSLGSRRKVNSHDVAPGMCSRASITTRSLSLYTTSWNTNLRWTRSPSAFPPCLYSYVMLPKSTCATTWSSYPTDDSSSYRPHNFQSMSLSILPPPGITKKGIIPPTPHTIYRSCACCL